MVRHAQSKAVKKLEAGEKKEQAYLDAIAEYKKEQEKTSGKKRGLREIAKEHKISPAGLGKRVKGGNSIWENNATKQLLTEEEERVVVQLIVISSDWGTPLKDKDIRRYAKELLRKKTGDSEAKVGKNWVSRFKDRHRKLISTYWSKALDTQRANSLNPAAVKDWFELVKKEVADTGVLPENIYAMDESGFPPSNQGTERVVGRKGLRIQHKQGSANRENVTALVTICADGTYLRPLVIFKGTYLKQHWVENNVADASFSTSPNGWTDSELAFEWLKEDFEPLTRKKANGNVRVIILDGHVSHLSIEFVQFCMDHNIVCLVYPPHCTHALQGLDVVCFAKMKKAWHDAIDEFEERTLHAVNKEDFLEVFGTAFLKAFDSETVRAAFRVTGVYPYDPTVITPRQMAPSEVTSIKTTFPLEQTSPVRRIVAVFDHQPVPVVESEADEIEETHPANAEHSSSLPPSSPPSTPTPAAGPSKRRIDASIDPDLYTPSKRRRILENSLSESATGSFLVSSARITPSKTISSPVLERPPPLREPNWSLGDVPQESLQLATKAQLLEQNKKLAEELQLSRKHVDTGRSIIKHANAQLVVQNLYAKKLNVAFKQKEKKKTTKSSKKLLKTGMGRVMTTKKTLDQLKVQEAEKQAELEEKEQRRAAREKKRGNKGEIERLWAEEGEAHTRRVAEWTAECARLKNDGIRVKDLPKKPSKRKKQDIIDEFNASSASLDALDGAMDDDEGEGDSESDDDGG